MTKIQVPKHIHMYKRVNLTRNPNKKDYWVFKCQKPMCRSHIPVSEALGQLAECNRCHNPFIIDKETIQLAKPHCQDCIVRKAKPEVDVLSDFVKDI